MATQEPTPTKEMIEAHEKTLHEVLDLVDKAQWKLSKEEPEIKFYTSSYPGSSFSMVKSIVSIPNKHDKLIEILSKVETYDQNTPAEKRDGAKERYLLGQGDAEHQTKFMYISLESGSRFVTDREFFMLRRHYNVDGKDIWLHCSVDGDNIVPPNKKNVRGKITFQTYILEKDPEHEGCDRLTFIVHADPCGSVPALIYNTVAVNQGYSAKKIRDEALQ